MKKLTAGIFTVLIGLCAANSADAAIASKAWVEQYAVSGDTYTTDKSTLESSIATAKKAGDDAAADLVAYKTENDAAVQANTDEISAIKNETTGILKQAKDYTDLLANGAVATNTSSIATINERLESVATTEGLNTLTNTVAGHTTAINTLNGTGEGSVSKSIADAVTALKNGEIKANTDAIDALEVLVGDTSVEAQVAAGIGGLDVTDTAVEKQFVTSVSETDGKITVSRAALVAADIPTIDQSQVSGLTDALNTKLSSTDAANTYQTKTAMATSETGDNTKYPSVGYMIDTINDTKTETGGAITAANNKITALENSLKEGGDTQKAIAAAQAAADAAQDDADANKASIEAEVTRAKAAEALNATAAANAQSAAEAAQTQADKGVADAAAAKAVADAAIPKPTANCTDLGAKCVLTVGTAGYAWELVERADNE